MDMWTGSHYPLGGEGVGTGLGGDCVRRAPEGVGHSDQDVK